MLNFKNAICLWKKHHSTTNQRWWLKYFEDNRDTLIPVYLPTTASPEFMVIEEVWNIAKRDLLVLNYYVSFADLKNKASKYFITKRFNLNIRNYLLREVR